jgi:hypothetical protein
MADFQSAGWFEVNGAAGRRRLCSTATPMISVTCWAGASHIDGTPYYCIGVNHFAHPPPRCRGERIGLLVKER